MSHQTLCCKFELHDMPFWSICTAGNTLPSAEVGASVPGAQGPCWIFGYCLLEFKQRVQIGVVIPSKYHTITLASYMSEQKQSKQQIEHDKLPFFFLSLPSAKAILDIRQSVDVAKLRFQLRHDLMHYRWTKRNLRNVMAVDSSWMDSLGSW